uniref:Alanine and proline rich membrane protein n=1 Tax=Mycobacterium riyadhense TaxID=486698 RepID=A0A653EDH2_9MYCO|nr:hypothetical protein BIN_B_01067 [Mycobacterium riyadhense]
MPDMPADGVPHAPGPIGFPPPPAALSPWPSPVPPASRTPSRWPGFVALAIALVAVGLAVAGWFRPEPRADVSPTPSTPHFTDQQVADAKANICATQEQVHQVVSINTNRQNPVPGDEIGRIAVAAHARLALFDGGAYLLDRLVAEPATPTDLANSVRALANSLQELAIGSMADNPDSIQDALRNRIGAETEAVDRLCK